MTMNQTRVLPLRWTDQMALTAWVTLYDFHGNAPTLLEVGTLVGRTTTWAHDRAQRLTQHGLLHQGRPNTRYGLTKEGRNYWASRCRALILWPDDDRVVRPMPIPPRASP